MSTLTQAQLEKLASDAGFKGDDIKIATAVALAESNGDTNSHNSTPPDDSYGLWQINMLGKLGPTRRTAFHISSNDQLYDPATNARAAYMVWTGSGWKAWTTYTSGKYKSHLSTDSTVSATDNNSTGILGSVKNVLSEPATIAGSITGAVNGLGQTVFRGASNIAGILVALVLLVLGIVLLSRNQIGSIIPAGKAAKAIKAVADK